MHKTVAFTAVLPSLRRHAALTLSLLITGGIEDLKPSALDGFDIQYANLSTLELAAAVDYASARGKDWLVGQSLGGHAIG